MLDVSKFFDLTEGFRCLSRLLLEIGKAPKKGLLVWGVLYTFNESIWDWTFFNTLGVDQTSRLGSSLHFFFYDLVKITLLLLGITFLVTLAQTYVTLCSCSSVPIFIGFVSSQIPIGITMTFLIASPLVSEVAFFMLFALFGWKLAFIYAISGIVISVVAGWVLGMMKAERWVEPFVYQTKAHTQPAFGVPNFTFSSLNS